MVPPVAANPPSANQTVRTSPASPLATSATKNSVMQDFDLMFRTFSPLPRSSEANESLILVRFALF